ncbi:RNA recognition motif domain-containing protein [Theileria equi strain WA]|uniref:RNA recognition motif domain-containing protein n=1 Tax=Theileria equi strain WA TaxID=1537102 RepID=L0B1X2_THEEQ|nr:RNA recognition motif domain-containing protein [Theileria equi strain WA]AFZ81246.1 RNA recognition motif domain-containing protein [Theileria equi strain WA]|eukprot:XP_004830912.1 RNA recognition motif domain-containing protein [Theileria equi strain WA]
MEKVTGYSLLIRNLRYSTSPQIVKETFERFGRIRDVYLPLDYNTRRPRGFGFVEYYEKEDVLEAVKAMDNADLDGSVITCCLAQDRRKSPNSMRRAYRGSRRGYDERRYRSRSRSYRDVRRSYSYGRRGRYDGDYYNGRRYSRDRSPERYSRDYRPVRDYRPHRDARRDYRPPMRDRRRDYEDRFQGEDRLSPRSQSPKRVEHSPERSSQDN